MDEIELTKLFVEYSETKKKLAELQAQIEAAVLALGESRKIAGVTATYYQPSHETPDYQGAALRAMPPDFDLSPYTKIEESVSWKSVCAALGVTPEPGAEKPARVAVK